VESGDRPGGLAAIRRAVEIREQLAKENFPACAHDLAQSLNNLSIGLAQSGDRPGGLAAIYRAVNIREQLESDQRQQAMAVITRAIELIQPFVSSGNKESGWHEQMQATLRRLMYTE
jgi:hypothetical protein